MNILFLSHRIPFPPNKGEKIRAFNELKHFSKTHTVDLLSFVDDPSDLAYADDLKQYCRSVKLISLDRNRQRLRAVASMLKSKPWTLGYFSSPGMWSAVREKLTSCSYDAIFVFCSSMAQYVASHQSSARILDFVDSDAAKWLQYGQFRSFPASWIYAYEGKKLARLEKALAHSFDACVFVSAREAAHLEDAATAGKIHFVQNGIQAGHFPAKRTRSIDNTIVFVGVMDYFPNVDAVCYFANEIFPIVRNSCPDARFLIVGRSPGRKVRKLADIPGITVTGAVPDVQPYLERAKVAVVPVRISRGIQNKLLEALAAGLPVVTTSAVAAGLSSMAGLPLVIADNPCNFAESVLSYLKDPLAEDQAASCIRILSRDYDWETNLSQFNAIFNTVCQKRRADLPESKALHPAMMVF